MKVDYARMEQVFASILKRVKPTEEEARQTIAGINYLTGRLGKIVPRSVTIRVVGSVAKGTYLRGDGDIDIFMLFNRNMGKEEISRRGMEYAKMLVNKAEGDRFEVKYAEHPYLRIYFGNGMKADIVPAGKMESAENLATAVDRTPRHADFINASLNDAQRDEVRLLKCLLKAHSVYGAEVMVGGFSGYLCELLIHQYGSLAKLIEAFSALELPLILDPLHKQGSREGEALKKFGKRFVVIDPVDPNRNVAAALSEESIARFVLVCREFLRKPGLEAFSRMGADPRAAPRLLGEFMKGSGMDFFLIEAEVPEKSRDVIWPQLRKASLLIGSELEKHGFGTYLNIEWVDGKKGMILMACSRCEVALRKIKGPDVFRAGNSSSFIESHRDAVGFAFDGPVISALERSRYQYAGQIFAEVVRGRVVKCGKDVKLRRAKLFVNKVPKRHAPMAYSGIISSIGI